MRELAEGKQSPRLIEIILISSLIMAIMSWSSQHLGVWERWEDSQAQLVESMFADQTWLQVNVPTETGRSRAVTELAPGWWPTLISVKWLQPRSHGWISPELALRLPAICLTGILISALYALMIVWTGRRRTALFACGLGLITPALTLGSQHALSSGGVGSLACALAMIGFILTTSSPRHQRLWWLISALSWVMSAISLGLLGLLLPIILLWYATRTKSEIDRLQVQSLMRPLIVPLVVIGLVYWRSWLKQVDGATFSTLFVFIDPLLNKYDYAEWEGFQTTLHLLGFALFPLGAFLPTLALGEHDRTKRFDQHFIKPSIRECLKLSFVLSFFGVVLLSPINGYWGGAAPLFVVPLAASAAYFWSIPEPRKDKSIMLWVVVIALWILVDSNLKREPGYLISSLTGYDPKGILSDLPTWRWTRRFTLLAILSLIVFKSPLLTSIGNKLGGIFRSTKPVHHHPALSFIALLGGLLFLLPQTLSVIPRWVVANAFVNASFWGRVTMNSRLFVLTAMGVLLSYWAAHLIWRLVSLTQQSKQRLLIQRLELSTIYSLLIITPHYLGHLPIWRFMRPVIEMTQAASSPTAQAAVLVISHMIIIIVLFLLISVMSWLDQKVLSIRARLNQLIDVLPSLWKRSRRFLEALCIIAWMTLMLGMMHISLPTALDEQMSHKPLYDRYNAYLSADHPLGLYQVSEQKRGYYLRDVPALSRAEFKQRIRSDELAFMIIERNRLSVINREFRKAQQAHLPIIDDSHPQLLLAANRLPEGIEDRNPIKHAVLSELPEGVKPLTEPINFEDKIELVAWRITPTNPSPGSSMVIEMFWRAKRKVSSEWKVFIHLDAPGERIHGDHEPVAGVYSMKDWQPGDLIRDEHHVTIKSALKAKTFTFFTGLYRGSKRMQIKNTSAQLKDKENRAKIGRLRLR